MAIGISDLQLRGGVPTLFKRDLASTNSIAIETSTSESYDSLQQYL